MELKRVFKYNIFSFKDFCYGVYVCSFHSGHFNRFSRIDAEQQDGQRIGSTVFLRLRKHFMRPRDKCRTSDLSFPVSVVRLYSSCC